eukprot:5853131-Prymnesium_polylepis.1
MALGAALAALRCGTEGSLAPASCVRLVHLMVLGAVIAALGRRAEGSWAPLVFACMALGAVIAALGCCFSCEAGARDVSHAHAERA